MWLHSVWSKGLHKAGNMWRQSWYLRCEGKGFLSDMQLVWTNSFRVLHVSFQIKALSGCMPWSRIAGSYGDCSHEIKRHLLLGRKAMTNLDSILKSRDITLLGMVRLFSQSYGFGSSSVWMWELDHEKAECWRIDAFELWCWRRLLRVPWTARRSNQSILKKISPKCIFEGLMLKLKLQNFGHLMWRTDSLEKVLMLGKTEGRRRG